VDVAIVGIGIHPFGRHKGVSGRYQGVHAAREALRDAGLAWGDIRFAAGGSMDAGDADSLVADLGLTGVPFVNVWNGCATGGSALTTAAHAIESGATDLAMAIGFDKHPPGAFNADPASLGLGEWYGETGLMLTTQFFALKAQRYLHEHGIGAQTLAAVAAKAFRNGSLNPNAWRRAPLTEEQILASTMVSHPLTQYMFCSPGEGGVALVLCRADRARTYTSHPIYLRSAELRSRRFGSFEVFSPWLSPGRSDSPSVDAARAAFEAAGVEIINGSGTGARLRLAGSSATGMR
jgi:acetyl-CoA acetyltransferase